jgi:serine protease AprX
VANKTNYTPQIGVLNLSLSAMPSTPYFADPLNIAVEKAWAAGIVVLAAAGNIGPEAETITVPGNNPYVITIGAIDSHRTPGFWEDDNVPTWSSTGPTFDGFFKPDVLAPGMNVVSYMHNGSGEIPYLVQIHPDYSENAILFRMNGTSMATAAASGVVALMLDHDPTLTPDEVKFRLLYSAQQTYNEYGEIVNNIFQQGAGRIWSPAAVYGDLPVDGYANGDMDITADFSHGWDTEEEIVFHYEGPVQKVLSEDGSVYLYFVDKGDGTAMALGASDAETKIWLTDDNLDDLAAVLPGGQMVWAGGQMVWAGGQMVWAGGQMVWAGGQMVWAGGQMVWAGGQMVWAGGQMVWAGGQMVWAGGAIPPQSGVQSPSSVNEDPVWIEGELVWSGSQVDWEGGQMVWVDGQMVWAGGHMDPGNTFMYMTNWVNDDGTVDRLPRYRKIFLPIFMP